MATMTRSTNPLDPRPLAGLSLLATILVLPILTLGSGILFAECASDPRERWRWDLARQWGGLAILSLGPLVFGLIDQRINGRFSAYTLILFAIGLRMTLSHGADRSWSANVGLALVSYGVILVFIVPTALIQRRVRRRRKAATAMGDSPMYDGDIDSL